MNNPPQKLDLTRLLLAGLVGAVVFVVYQYWIDDLIALPLREVSTIIAGAILQACGMVVERQGTILLTPSVRFTVIDACSGSNTLSTMLTLGLVWICIQQTLLGWRRVLVAIALVPIALLSNGARVAALVGIAHMLGRPIEEGPLHTWIGLAAFILSILLVFALVFLLRQSTQIKREAQVVSTAIKLATLLFLFLIYAPFIVRCILVWSGSSYTGADTIGWLYVLAGLGLTVGYLIKVAPGPRQPRFAWVSLILAMLMMLVSLRVQLNLLLGFSLLPLLLSVALFTLGRAAYPILPLLVVMLLGYPQVAGILERLLQLPGGIEMTRLWLVILLCGFFYLWWFYNARKAAVKSTSVYKGMPWRVCAALFAGCLLLRLLLIAAPAQPGPPLRPPYYLAGWVGQDAYVSPEIRRYLGEGVVLARAYRKEGVEVTLLATDSRGDRHQIHQPAYCLTGGGWRIDARQQITASVGREQREVTLLQLHRKGAQLRFVYWYGAEDLHASGYTQMIASDILQRLLGTPSSWYVVRLYTQGSEEDLRDFMQHLSLR